MAVPTPTRSASPPAKKVKIAQDAPSAPSADDEVNGASASSSSATVDPETAAALKLHPFPTNVNRFIGRAKRCEKSRQSALAKTGEEPVWFDIVALLGEDKINDVMRRGPKGASGEWVDRFPRDTILDGKVERLNSHGAGLIVAPTRDWVLEVPHVLPGEMVRVRVDRNERMYSKCDLVEVLQKSPERRDDLVGCKYFGECPGCQYQMIPYEKQLQIKRDVVTRAFAHFSDLDSSLIPETLTTLPSPLQYAYRTKLTPHFEVPRSLTAYRQTYAPDKLRPKRGRDPKAAQAALKEQNRESEVSPEEMEKYKATWAAETDFGFDKLKGGGRGILDIEECPIATSAINKALVVERQKVKSGVDTWPAGATILLRDSFTPSSLGFTDEQVTKDPKPTRDGEPTPGCDGDAEVITSYRAIVREKVDDVLFETPSGSFFQNNRSILPSLVGYVREAILHARGHDAAAAAQGEHFLVDTYCGSGLFALCLAPLFSKVAGVEIATESITFAERNAALNGITNATFLAGHAEAIFAKIAFDPARTTVVIDPPRRGCDEAFVEQLARLAPSLVVYVSCNVHTQARDVGQFLRKRSEYEIVSVRGADLFPQTHHVEGICVLRRRDVKPQEDAAVEGEGEGAKKEKKEEPEEQR